MSKTFTRIIFSYKKLIRTIRNSEFTIDKLIKSSMIYCLFIILHLIQQAVFFFLINKISNECIVVFCYYKYKITNLIYINMEIHYCVRWTSMTNI